MNNEHSKQIFSLTVKQPNIITEARYEMSALQKNILYLLLAQLKDEFPTQKKYVLSIQDINNSRNIRVRRAEFRQAARGLMEKVFTLRDEQDRFITIGVLSSADYGKETNKENLIIEFDPKLYPLLYNIKRKFTAFSLEDALILKSKYSKRIYEMLSQFKDTGIFKVSVQELKERLGLINLETRKEEYLKFGEFARAVLEVAKKEINEQTDISFTYVTKKTGKKITDLEFYITYKPSTSFQ